MDKSEFLEICENWYEVDEIRRNAEQIIHRADELGHSVTFYRSSSRSKNPRSDIVAEFSIGGCPMLCIRGYDPDWKPAIQFVHRDNQTREAWRKQSDLFKPSWKRLANFSPEHRDGKISLRMKDAASRASEALEIFAKIIAEHPNQED